ncbi:MAG: hypothetical protein ACKVQJ_14545 [Pyrinomonadaceae bacterium]
MKRIGILILTVAFTFPIFAQQRPLWIQNVEASIKEKESALVLKNITEKNNEGWRQYAFSTEYNGVPGNVSIEELGNVSNYEETFLGFVTVNNNLMGPNTGSREIKDFGDVGYLWYRVKDESWKRLYFRRKRFIVEITLPETIARRLAKIIDDQISR